MRFYRFLSLAMTIIFFSVGMIFLFIPDKVLVFFNNISANFGMTPSPVITHNLYVILAVGYMYLVTLLAFLMWLRPDVKYFPFLLANGKTVSSILSLWLFIFHASYLVYMINAVADGLIAGIVWWMYAGIKKHNP